ncbi:MAG: NAD(P)-binding protein [Myxococcales bacterium]|nr:NAD(P)-binding protein [Myxococcales bacterium]
MSKTRVLVIGAGPAGLSAATRLLEKAPGQVEVTLMHMGHHLGGKASSYEDDEDYTVEHGWHMMLGFYRKMRGLMGRAGIDLDKTLVSMKGNAHPFEPWSGKIHTLNWKRSTLSFMGHWLAYSGLPLGDRLNFGRFMAQTFIEADRGGDLTRHDDLCFRTWAIERGLKPHITRYSLFRNFREAYFNVPESISAYHMLKSMKLMSTPKRSEMFVVRGGFSEHVWGPIGAYFEKLGGTIVPFSLATDWVYEGRRITGVRIGRPDSSGHDEGMSAWKQKHLPIKDGSDSVHTNFDSVISTIPVAVLAQMNREDARMWASPYFSRLSELRSGVTLSMTVHTKQPWMKYPGPVFGLPAPMGIAVNMTPYWNEYKGQNIRSAIHFMGQEGGFEDWSDEQIIAFTLDNFSGVGALGSIRDAGIRYLEFHRNRSAFEQLMLCEPGVQKFRPGVRTPFLNLYVAGDWVRNEVDLICMEGAISSGAQAADTLLEDMAA